MPEINRVKHTYLCDACRQENSIPFQEVIDAEKDADIHRDMKDGSFFLHKCPHCGKENVAVYPLLYVDHARKTAIELVTDEESMIDAHEELCAGYVKRTVNNPADFMDKLNILDENLDDRVIEIMKAVIYFNLTTEKDLEIEEVFFTPSTEGNIFDILGSDMQQLGHLSFNQEMYDDIIETYIEMLSPQLANARVVDAAWVAKAVRKQLQS